MSKPELHHQHTCTRQNSKGHFTFSHENPIPILTRSFEVPSRRGTRSTCRRRPTTGGSRGLGGFGRRDVVEIRNGLLGAGTYLAFATGHCGWWCWYGSVALAGSVAGGRYVYAYALCAGWPGTTDSSALPVPRGIVCRGPGIESRRQLHQLVIGWDCLGSRAKAQPAGRAKPKPRPGQRTRNRKCKSSTSSTSEEQQQATEDSDGTPDRDKSTLTRGRLLSVRTEV